MPTVRGVYLDLKESKFIFEYGKLKFVFSSKIYLNKFKNNYISYLRDETNKLHINYKGTVCADDVLLLKLYKIIEKRGFLVYYNNKELLKDYFIDFTINIKQSI